MASRPTLVAGLLPDKFVSSAIARTANVLAASTAGAANGVAQLDAAALLPPDQVEAGGVIAVRWTGSWPAARPTSSTAITVWCLAPASISPAASWSSSGPAWMATNDRLIIV